jgi:hypothetical protein
MEHDAEPRTVTVQVPFLASCKTQHESLAMLYWKAMSPQVRVVYGDRLMTQGDSWHCTRFRAGRDRAGGRVQVMVGAAVLTGALVVGSGAVVGPGGSVSWESTSTLGSMVICENIGAMLKGKVGARLLGP